MSNESKIIAFDGLNNTRDLGGMRTADGHRIRPGKLFRSGGLFEASEADRARLAEMVDLIVDFRSDMECEERPDPEIPGVKRVEMPLLETLSPGVERDKKAQDEAFHMLVVDPGRAEEYMCGLYRDFISGEFAQETMRAFFQLVLQSREKGVLFHCTAGKDRTGFSAILLEELLGVDRESVRADYLRTDFYLKEEVQQLCDMMRRRLDRQDAAMDRALDYLYGAKEEYFDALYQEAEQYYGGMDGFFEKALQLGESERTQLKSLYLQPED